MGHRHHSPAGFCFGKMDPSAITQSLLKDTLPRMHVNDINHSKDAAQPRTGDTATDIPAANSAITTTAACFWAKSE
ncbi:hypothetical protein E2C01_089698 [Portunus trituberculatus]|uniref:Uncharacterized protein n=1 Tax=Portunus trituberculatus TaxID=210409 RepID=A0A5B7JIY5_PORTR|nr:hypothetical protein [Portunus trituberculatus]